MTALIILGMHRSGTSALTRVTNLLGADLGTRLIEPGPANPTGFWEHEEVNTLDDSLMKALDAWWDSSLPLPDKWWEKPEVVSLKPEMKSILEREFKNSPLFAIKDPRMCRLIPVWSEVLTSAGHDVCYLLMRRHPVEVADSITKRDGLTRNHGLLLWLLHTLEGERNTRGKKRCLASYDALLADWRKMMKAVGEKLSITWPTSIEAAGAEIDAFLSPAQKHNKASTETKWSEFAPLEDWSKKTFAAMQELEKDDSASTHKVLDEIYSSLMSALEGSRALTGFWQYEAVSARKSFDAEKSAHALDNYSHTTQLKEAWEFVHKRNLTALEYQEKLEQSRGKLNEMKEALDAIYNSRSWKATRALRYAGRIARGYRDVIKHPPELNKPVAQDKLTLKIESGIADKHISGSGFMWVISGYMFNPAREIEKVAIELDGQQVAVVPQQGHLRGDVAMHFCVEDPSGYSLTSGFCFTIPVGAEWAGKKPKASMTIFYKDGGSENSSIGTTNFEKMPFEPAKLPSAVEAGNPNNPLIAICMAAYAPKMDQISMQLDSIIAQTHKNWICIVNDDASSLENFEQIKQKYANEPRIIFSRNQKNLGFYRNFEAALYHAPKEADFIAFSDQDDKWYPEKLEILLAKFTPETQLVYSDMRIVDDNGKVLSNTFWQQRKNQYTNLEALLVANTVTGAASMFRTSLLEKALPFPEKCGDIFHDHWLACVAASVGKIGFVEKPLYDYIQHGNNTLGYSEINVSNWWEQTKQFLRIVRNVMLSIFKILIHPKHTSLAEPGIAHNNNIYFMEYRRLSIMSKTLRLRLGDKNVPAALKIFDEEKPSALSMLGLAVRGLTRINSTYHAEGRLAGSFMVYRFGKWIQTRAREDVCSMMRWKRGLTQQNTMLGAPLFLERKIAPLTIDIKESEPVRVNVLIPEINFGHFFGGYIGKFQFVLKLKAAGFKPRMVIVDPCQVNLSEWRKGIAHYPGLENFFDDVEVAYHYDRSVPLAVNPNDRIVASTWWTAHIAAGVAKQLNVGRFLYFIQEYEPFTFPMGSYFALADASYNFPHDALFSTSFLEEYFRLNKLGVYSDKLKATCSGQYFSNAILPLKPNLPHEGKKKLLFYARPEGHAARNMFELSVMALIRAVDLGIFPKEEWELHGVGSNQGDIQLTSNSVIKMHGKLSLEGYQEMITQYDLGLSLMFTPHPSLLPLEMAAAGLVVVTNSCLNKTADSFAPVSSNLIIAEPTVEGIVGGLREAAKRANDIPARIEGSKVNWPMSWPETFHPELMKFIVKCLEQKQASRPVLERVA